VSAGAAPGAQPTPARLPSLLLGDNPFFGVNHMSEERARAQAIQFQDDRAILDVIDAAYDEGIRAFMCTTHQRVGGLVDQIRARPADYADYAFYPCMPYAHKYANAVTEDGILGALRRFLPENGILNTVAKGGKSLATKDVEGLSSLLVDAEMSMFRDVRTPVVFLQNVVVDLLLGLGFTDALRYFADHVRERYGAEPGFITMNLPLLVRALERSGVENPVVCANINKIGFRMSGGAAEYQAVLAAGGFRAVAMSVFASGAIPPREALEWVCSQPGVESIVFGASSRRSIASTRALVEEFWPTGSTRPGTPG
jgi:hypothetical protein